MATKVTYIKTSSISRKILQLMMGVALLIFTLSLWSDIKIKGEQLLVENAIVLAKNILKQTAHSAAYYITKDDKDSLNHLSQSALSSDYIYEMLIYDKYGKILSKSDNALSAKSRFMKKSAMAPIPKLSDVDGSQPIAIQVDQVTTSAKSTEITGINDANIDGYLPVPYVAEINSEQGALLGFVRVTVLTKNLQKTGLSYIQTLTKQVILIALLAGFIGYLFTNGLKPFSANAYMVKD